MGISALPSRDETTPGTTPILEFRAAGFGLTARPVSPCGTLRDSFDPVVLFSPPVPTAASIRSCPHSLARLRHPRAVATRYATGNPRCCGLLCLSRVGRARSQSIGRGCHPLRCTSKVECAGALRPSSIMSPESSRNPRNPAIDRACGGVDNGSWSGSRRRRQRHLDPQTLSIGGVGRGSRRARLHEATARRQPA